MEHIRLEINNAIAKIIIDRPDCQNAMDDTTIREMQQAINEVSADPNIRILQLTGQGKTFCAGADLRWMQRMVNYSEVENTRDATALADLLLAIAECPLPTMALVNGPAIGGGAGLVAACDIAIAQNQAFCQFSEVKIGLMPAVISPYVMNCIGRRYTQYYFLTAERIDAATAEKLGLFQRVTSAEQFETEISTLCHTLLQNSPAALTACKKLLTSVSQEKNIEIITAITANAIASIRVSPEGQEGLKSFLEKRKPTWITPDV